jgi:predicted metal-dependent enzyme (double-stranded beta helix superfamily)
MRPDPEMSPSQLLDLVDRLAADDSTWRHLVRHDPNRRNYEQLLLDERVGVWLICWMDDHDTGFHDHDVSSGAVAVIQGQVREERLAVGGHPQTCVYHPGESFTFEASDIHRMSHAGGGPAVSIHAYSPPLHRMGSYSIDRAGVLHRSSIPYEQELKPAELAA